MEGEKIEPNKEYNLKFQMAHMNKFKNVESV